MELFTLLATLALWHNWCNKRNKLMSRPALFWIPVCRQGTAFPLNKDY